MKRAFFASLLLSAALPASAIPVTWEASGTLDYVSDTAGLLPFTVNAGDAWTLTMRLDTELLPYETDGSTFSQFRGFDGGQLTVGSNVLDLPSSSFLTYVNIGNDATSHFFGVGFQSNNLPQPGSYVVSMNLQGLGAGPLAIDSIPFEPPSLNDYSSFAYFNLIRFGDLNQAGTSYTSGSIGDNNIESLIKVASPSASVPEPGTVALLSMSFAALALFRRRTEKRSA